MTKVGTVIDGKFEILKEIGRGGMSIVYLAMDKHLNKQWAVKEIRKRGNGENDEICVNSLLAEANLMKKLDHPSLPRIVDIIDNGSTIYVVMDYIEGESLDKILNEYGAQSEELVVGWAKQLCDALSYLHAQKPPIVYRDMKPANVMLKPEGNIKIIDFGIAREYKEQNLADTKVLGTKGYAPPEQYSGQTDPRSDIFALGMTMHHLLTGVDPRNGEPYAPVRQWNPELSEGIEIIIDRCVEPAAENRYQSCADLLYDLEHPDLITKGYKKKQKIRLASFIVSMVLSVLMCITGTTLYMTAKYMNNNDYDEHIKSTDPERYFTAVEIYPERVKAYDELITYCLNHKVSNEDITKVGNVIEANAKSHNKSDSAIAEMYYDMGKLYFAFYDDSFKAKAISAQKFFQEAATAEADFAKKGIAASYCSICEFMTTQSIISEHSLEDYNELLKKIEDTMEVVETISDVTDNEEIKNEINKENIYDRIYLYYTAMLFINDQAEYMAGVEFDRQTVLELMRNMKEKTLDITANSEEVNRLQDKIRANYDAYIANINAKYNEVEKRRQGGN